jgi:uracil phosphoribosyltransferase
MNNQLTILNCTDQIKFLHTKIRDVKTSRTDFKFYSDRLIRLLIEEALNHLPYIKYDVLTATNSTFNGVLPAGKICGVSIMRAGESMEKALLETCRGARIGKILIQRDESTPEKIAKYSYSKMPDDIGDRYVFLMDPMLASGGSAKKALEILINMYGVPEDKIVFVNIICCQEGLDKIKNSYPNIKIVTSYIDPILNENKYIVPGLGDFGDRYFGT